MSVCNTSHKSIFNYWKDKCISYDGKIYTEGKYDYTKSIPVIKDWGEPECWCCGKFAFGIYNHEDYEKNLTNGEYERIWEYKEVKSLLNRCHIIPDVLNGDDKPYNLFLLCSKCHKDSPDINNRQLFFRWIYKQRTKHNYNNGVPIDTYYNEIKEECNVLNKNFLTINTSKIGDDINAHGGSCSQSSIFMSIVNSASSNNLVNKGE